MTALREIAPVHLVPFKELVLRTCGLLLEKEREPSLQAALRERMAARGMASVTIYFECVQRDSEELARFVERLTVNETYFMREPGHLGLLARHLVPELLSSRTGPVRILSAGCSSGEEPYSVAILLSEIYGAACEKLFIITGLDIDAQAVAAARKGVYGRHSFRGLDPVLMERHFEAAGHGRHRIREATRRLVDFTTHNLLSEPFPPSLRDQDIVLYRNVSIYFPREVQQSVFSSLAGVLHERGFLIVGATETLHHDLGILPLVEREGLFLFHREAAPARSKRSERPHVAPVPASRPRSESRGGIRLHEDRPADVFASAFAQAQNRSGASALRSLEVILREDPGSRQALTLKASILMEEARYDEAARVCEQVLARESLSPEACLMLGIIARRAGNDVEAHRRFREALYADPTCWLASFCIAECLMQKGEANRARAGYESALRILEDPARLRPGERIYPLSFNREQFMLICRHKLSMLQENA